MTRKTKSENFTALPSSKENLIKAFVDAFQEKNYGSFSALIKISFPPREALEGLNEHFKMTCSMFGISVEKEASFEQQFQELTKKIFENNTSLLQDGDRIVVEEFALENNPNNYWQPIEPFQPFRGTLLFKIISPDGREKKLGQINYNSEAGQYFLDMRYKTSPDTRFLAYDNHPIMNEWDGESMVIVFAQDETIVDVLLINEPRFKRVERIEFEYSDLNQPIYVAVYGRKVRSETKGYMVATGKGHTKVSISLSQQIIVGVAGNSIFPMAPREKRIVPKALLWLKEEASAVIKPKLIYADVFKTYLLPDGHGNLILDELCEEGEVVRTFFERLKANHEALLNEVFGADQISLRPFYINFFNGKNISHFEYSRIDWEKHTQQPAAFELEVNRCLVVTCYTHLGETDPWKNPPYNTTLWLKFAKGELKVSGFKVQNESQAQARKMALEVADGLLKLDHLEINVAYDLIPLVDKAQGGDLLEMMTLMRNSLAITKGLEIDPIRVRDNMNLSLGTTIILIDGLTVETLTLRPKEFLILETKGLAPLIAPDFIHPMFENKGKWMPADTVENFNGYQCLRPAEVIMTHLTWVLTHPKYLPLIFTVNAAMKLLKFCRKNNELLVDEVMDKYLNMTELYELLLEFLKAGLSIKPLSIILEMVLNTYGKAATKIVEKAKGDPRFQVGRLSYYKD